MSFLRSMGRATTITFFLLWHFVRWFGVWLAMLISLRPAEARKRWFGQCLVALLRDLGATFIKVGQIMSTRPDLFPPHVVAALESLQDQVGPFPYEAVRRTIREDLGQDPEALFESFSKEPIASASVAQVHRARLADGRVLAVKVRRPDIEHTVRFDLGVMRAVARALSVIPTVRLMAPVETASEFGRGVAMQLDFVREAQNNERFRRMFAGDPDVIFPALVPDLCTGRVLTMEFIEGAKILQFRRTPHDPTRLARIGFRVLFKMIFEDGFVHADLHPGNIFVTEDGKVAILDLGLVGELDEAHRHAFGQWFAAWASADARTMARIMVEFSPTQARMPHFDAFERDLEAFVKRTWGRRLEEVSAAELVFDMMNILRRHRVRVNPTFTMVNIALAVTEGIGKQLDPKLDLMAEAAPYFARAQLFRNGAPAPGAPAV